MEEEGKEGLEGTGKTEGLKDVEKRRGRLVEGK